MIEEKQIPELRFLEFEDEWKNIKLEKLVKFKKGKGIPKRALSISGNKCILYGELYTKYNEVIKEVHSRTKLDTSKLRLSKAGDVLIPSSGELALDMSLSSALLIDNIALGGDINILRPNKEKINSIFLSYQLNSSRKFDLARIAEGASIVHLYNSNLEKLYINYPSIKEQEKIGNLFSKIDKKIELQEVKIEKLDNYKKGLMQRIFNQEVRFKDKNRESYPEWGKIKLKKILEEKKEMREKNKGIPHASLTKKGIELKTDRYNRDFLVKTDNKKYKVSRAGDICYNPANLKFGVITVNQIGTVIFSPIYVTFVVKKEVNFKYLSYYMMRWDFINKVRKYEEGTVYERMAVKPIDFLKYEIKIPVFSEQEKIANCLSAIDRKINLQKEQLENYKEYKKGLLQRMFI